jgi:hypothetical protein
MLKKAVGLDVLLPLWYKFASFAGPARILMLAEP